MFDPTIFDNLKVVLEGHIYELDFSNQLKVTNRKDAVDIATMSREFIMEFQTVNNTEPYPFAEIKLTAKIEDFVKEMIYGEEEKSGCEITVNLYTKVNNIEDDPNQIKTHLNKIWKGRPLITQQLSFYYENEKSKLNKVNLDFNRKINEDQVNDIPNIVDISQESLEWINHRFSF